MYDIINSDRVIRKNLLQKLKTAARISKTEYFWLSDPSCDINLAWEPDPEVKDYNHIFGSDLNHIEAIFTNKSQIKKLEKFANFIEHSLDAVKLTHELFNVDSITTEILRDCQEKSELEWIWVVEGKYNYDEFDFNWRPDPWNEYHYYNFADKVYLIHKKADLNVTPEYDGKYIGHVFKFNFDIIKEPIFRKTLLQKIKTAARLAYTVNFWIVNGNYEPDMYWEPFDGEKDYFHIFGSDLNHIQAIFVNSESIKKLDKFENYILHEINSNNLHNNIVHLEKIINIEDLREQQSLMEDEWLWVVESHYDYSKFDFSWRPDPWNSYNWYNFGNKAYLLHKNANLDNDYDLISKEFYRVTLPILAIDTLGNGNGISYENYKDVIIKACDQTSYSLFWLTANHIDTSNFDVSWFPNYSDIKYLHCWATGDQDKGDIFFVNKESINNDAEDIFDLAEIKFHESKIPNVEYKITYSNTDNLPSLINKTTVELPWNFVVNSESNMNPYWNRPQPCYWYGPRIETYGDNNSVILYHRDLIREIKTEIYDFPTIIKNRRIASYDRPLDVIFLSAGEYYADANFNHLKSIYPTAKHISGINGRAASYKTMAEASDTQWFFAVFAKLQVYKEFDFTWKPDRLQAPKHYIFKATNTINGLYYGHMAMIAANKNIILNQTDYELDFTLGGEHTVVDINSGRAYFGESPLATWRTAFRECVKLTHNLQTNSLDMESFDRLNTWLNVAEGHYADYCLKGARDGYDYAKQNEGNIVALKLTREWDWLDKYFSYRYSQQLP